MLPARHEITTISEDQTRFFFLLRKDKFGWNTKRRGHVCRMATTPAAGSVSPPLCKEDLKEYCESSAKWPPAVYCSDQTVRNRLHDGAWRSQHLYSDLCSHTAPCNSTCIRQRTPELLGLALPIQRSSQMRAVCADSSGAWRQEYIQTNGDHVDFWVTCWAV